MRPRQGCEILDNLPAAAAGNLLKRHFLYKAKRALVALAIGAA
jgi:hypothetical protein